MGFFRNHHEGFRSDGPDDRKPYFSEASPIATNLPPPVYWVKTLLSQKILCDTTIPLLIKHSAMLHLFGKLGYYSTKMGRARQQ
jgi:hypothetical protein